MPLPLRRLHHIAIISADYPRSLHFYTHILGLTLRAEHYRAERQSYKADLTLGDTYVVELFSFPNPPPRPGSMDGTPEACGLRHLAFAVADIPAKRAELQALGVACEPIRIDEYTGKQLFFIKDPDGLPLEFYQQ